jgi:ribonuclease
MDHRQPRGRLAGSLVALVLFAVIPAMSFAGDPALELRDFARHVGISDVDGFADTVDHLRADHHLPERYLTKRRAGQRGWRPGGDLCRVAPGGALGGDHFGNRDGRLPQAAGRRWFEADLDYGCGHRGAHRLLWSSDGLYYVTVDHYRTFVPVPPAAPN